MYSAPLHAILRLMIFEKSEAGAAKTIRDVKEQEVYMGEIPLMTENGTFIINGTERVVVSQMHRSPGVFFDHDKGRRIRPENCFLMPESFRTVAHGLISSLIRKDLLYVRIDRRRKLPGTIILQALGYTTEEILQLFFVNDRFTLADEGGEVELVPERLRGQELDFDLVVSGNNYCRSGNPNYCTTCPRVR